ncbi:MAG: hypothetical protein ACHQ1H_08345 [Nitrososphaerales archaeon]
MITIVTFYIADFQYYPFLRSVVTPEQDSLFPVTLAVLSFVAGLFYIREKNAGWRFVYAVTLPLAFLAIYEFVWRYSFKLAVTNVSFFITDDSLIYMTALLGVLTLGFFLAHYRAFNLYYLMLAVGVCNIFVTWVSLSNSDLGALRSWFLPIVPLLLIGFTSLGFWHYSSGALLLFLANTCVFVFWVWTEPTQPATTLNLLLNATTKTLLALFFVSLLDPIREPLIVYPSSSVPTK